MTSSNKANPGFIARMLAFDLCLIKTKKWELEDEERFLKVYFVNRKWSIKSSIIREIIIGQDILEDSKKQLLNYVTQKYHDCKLYIANRPKAETDKSAKLIDI